MDGEGAGDGITAFGAGTPDVFIEEYGLGLKLFLILPAGLGGAVDAGVSAAP